MEDKEKMMNQKQNSKESAHELSQIIKGMDNNAFAEENDEEPINPKDVLEFKEPLPPNRTLTQFFTRT